jgi:dihydrofolate reductase
VGSVGVFVHVSLDGYFAGPNGEIDWFKAIRPDDEYAAYTHGQSQSGSTLVFGRTTYDMMRSWWPTPKAIAGDPQMARVVNESPKIVFSKTMPSAEEGPNWKNVTLLRDIDAAGIRKRKAPAGAALTILGSGTVVREFANLGLIDEYAIVVVPILLGAGKPLFEGVRETPIELVESRSFRNGLVVLRYRPNGSSPSP